MIKNLKIQQIICAVLYGEVKEEKKIKHLQIYLVFIQIFIYLILTYFALISTKDKTLF